jgi:hypothetical protein
MVVCGTRTGAVLTMVVCGTRTGAVLTNPAIYEGERTVRKVLSIKRGLAATVAAAAVIASLLALASGGQAASPSICITASTDTADPTCLTELVTPHVLTAGGDAVSITRFTNQSGVGGATATHVVLSVTFPGSATVSAITILLNGAVSSTPCTPPSSSVSVVSCPVGNIVGGGKAKMIVRFSTSTGGVLKGGVNYGEGGNDSSPPHPNGTVNDTQVARDTFAIAGASAAGNCYNVGNSGLANISGSTTAQSTAASVGQADSSLNLPCTPVSAGVDIDSTHRPQGFTQNVSFVEFMALAGNAPGTVTIDFLSSVPKGFVLKELKLGSDPTLAISWTEVPTCASNPSGGDSCIVSKKNLPKGGLEYILNVLGSSFDPRYGG